YHSLAILNRESETLRLKKDMSRLNFEASTLYGTALEQEGKNNFYFSLQNYFAAEEKKFDILSMGLVYLSIRLDDEVSFGLPKQTFCLSIIEEKLQSFIGDLTLAAISPVEIDATSVAEVEPIQVSLARFHGDKKIPFEGAPFKSECEEGEAVLIRQPKSNKDGVCTLWFGNMKAGPTGITAIKIRFDTSNFLKYYKNPYTLYWLSQLEKKSLDFKFLFQKQ
ncbi:hypothetical protein KKB18_02065, partial [bacterium]|nr:hypothetical protein [bacterium]